MCSCCKCRSNGCTKCCSWVVRFAKRGLIILLVQILGAALFFYIEEEKVIIDCLTRPLKLAEEDQEMQKYTRFMINLEMKANKTLSMSERQRVFLLFRGFFKAPLKQPPIYGLNSWAMAKCMKWYRFSVMTMTTIGLGTITPQTNLGKALVIPYALITIPLMLSFLAFVGSHVSGFAECLVKCIHRGIRGNKPLKFKKALRTFCLLLIAIMYINVAISRVQSTVQLPYLDTFYFYFVAYSTVGFGDISTPAENPWFYFQDLVYGLAALSGLVNSILDFYKEE